MDKDETLRVLKDYQSELDRILGRFKHSPNGIHIQAEDDPRFRQLVIELSDFLDDILGKNSYSNTIVNYFNTGVANFSGSPSYHSVESIRGVVSAVITRIERNSEILLSAQTSGKPEVISGENELEFPPKVTLTWLVRHVPVKLWITAAGLLLAAFLFGIQASRISTVKEIFVVGSQQQAGTPSLLKDRK